jgi:hypothetical protein
VASGCGQRQLAAGGKFAHLLDRLGAKVLAVGTVVSNQPGLKEPLGDLRGHIRLEPERDARCLEQCRGGKRRRRSLRGVLVL